MSRLLDDDELQRQLGDLPGWSGDVSAIRCSYGLPSFTAAIATVVDVGVEAEEMDHHPDIDIRWRTVTFALSTHSAGGVTQLDVELAHRIARIARSRGGE